jgi:hypothetical protein
MLLRHVHTCTALHAAVGYSSSYSAWIGQVISQDRRPRIEYFRYKRLVRSWCLDIYSVELLDIHKNRQNWEV